MYFLNLIYMGILFICSCIHASWIFGSECIWQNQRNGCAPSEDSDQPGRSPSLIRIFAVRMKKHWVHSYALSAVRRLWSDWADAKADLSLRWVHTHVVGFVMSWLMVYILKLFLFQLSSDNLSCWCSSFYIEWYYIFCFCFWYKLQGNICEWEVCPRSQKHILSLNVNF